MDHTTVRNPLLVDRGIKSLLGVPLLAGGQVIGVLHVGSLSGRRFGRRKSNCSSWPPTGPRSPCSR